MMLRYAIAAASLLFLVVAAAILMGSLRSLPLSRRLLYLLFPLSQILILVFLLSYMLAYGLPLWLFALVAFAAILCGVGDVFLFRALRSAEEKDLTEERIRILENQTALQKEYLERIAADAEETENTRRLILEDLHRIGEFLDREEISQAEVRLTQMVGRIESADKHFCAHPAIDALMMMKASICEASGILLACDLAIPEDIPLSSIDLCAAFSNILDNAIEGCKESGVDDPSIRVTAGVSKGYFLLNVENSCPLNPSGHNPAQGPFKPGKGLPAHGWGLQILQGLAQRHDGSLKTERSISQYRTSLALKLDIIGSEHQPTHERG